MYTFLISALFLVCFAQNPSPPTLDQALEKFGFIQEQIVEGNDTITYFLRNYTSQPNKLVVFIQGTEANPIFSYSENKDQPPTFYRWFGSEYQLLDSTYTYAIVPKPGMAGLYKDGAIQIPTSYYTNNYLDYRVKQLDRSIQHIVENHLSKAEKVIVYGHSEGAAIGAALANVNPSITHLGFWSGNVLNNFYEFALFNRIEALQGTTTDAEAHQNILGILEWYQGVLQAPNSTELDHFGFTNKRWSTYEKAPIDYLLQLDLPIYALFATQDESTPIETAYLLPIKFMEHRKTNLTFEVCLGCDHAYQLETPDGKKALWQEQFLKFMEWAEKVAPVKRN